MCLILSIAFAKDSENADSGDRLPIETNNSEIKEQINSIFKDGNEASDEDSDKDSDEDEQCDEYDTDSSSQSGVSNVFIYLLFMI